MCSICYTDSVRKSHYFTIKETYVFILISHFETNSFRFGHGGRIPTNTMMS